MGVAAAVGEAVSDGEGVGVCWAPAVGDERAAAASASTRNMLHSAPVMAIDFIVLLIGSSPLRFSGYGHGGPVRTEPVAM